MKVNVKDRNIKRSGVQETIQCGMQVNSHAFQLLARQYSNPIKAILQELSANAIDSHIRAGKADVPFKVQLPHALDPHIRIRDYGVSMSPQVIRNVYANYMKSDKQNTNDEAGYFGIGSKTPLAYTDSFNITTYLDGVCRFHSLVYNEKGIPELNIFDEVPTKEDNGVEISFSIAREDWKKFELEAKHVYSFYDVQPKVNGVDNFSHKTYPIVLEGKDKDWKFVENSTDSYVIMGNIGYKIDTYQVNSTHSQMLNCGLHFKVRMADVSIIPSREGLEYNTKTKETIRRRLEEIDKEVNARCEEELAKCKSEWQRSILSKQFFENLGLRRNNVFTSKYKKTFTIDTNKALYKFCPSSRYYWRNNNDQKVTRTQNVGWGEYPISNDIRLVIKDIKSKFSSRSKYLAEQDGIKDVILLTDDYTLQDLYTLTGSIKEDRICLLASELKDPPKDPNKVSASNSGGPRKKKTTRTVKLFKPKGDSQDSNSIYESKYWEDYEIDPKVGKHIFVNLNRYVIKSNDIRLQTSNLAYIKDPIYGINSSTEKLADRKNFISFVDHLKEKFDKEITDDVRKQCQKNIDFVDISDISALKAIAESKWYGQLTNNKSKFKEFMDVIKDFVDKDKKTKFANLIDICDTIGYDLKLDRKKARQSELYTLYNETKKKYPLIFKLTSYLWLRKNSSEIEDIIKTVKAIDNFN